MNMRKIGKIIFIPSQGELLLTNNNNDCVIIKVFANDQKYDLLFLAEIYILSI